MGSLLDRFSEPSSYAGIAPLLVALHVNLDPSLLKSGSLVLAGVAGLLAFFLKEKAKPAA